MDFNYLYHRQQVELMRASAALCARSEKAHRELAALYDAIIERYKTPARNEACEA